MISDYFVKFLPLDLPSFFEPKNICCLCSFRFLFRTTKSSEPECTQCPSIINETYLLEESSDSRLKISQKDEYKEGDLIIVQCDTKHQEYQDAQNEEPDERHAEENNQETEMLDEMNGERENGNRNGNEEKKRPNDEDNNDEDGNEQHGARSLAEKNAGDRILDEAILKPSAIQSDGHKAINVNSNAHYCFCCDCKKQAVCNDVCIGVLTTIVEKSSNASYCELAAVETKAENLWNLITKELRGSSGGVYMEWCGLRSWQKLPFYWTALPSDVLYGNPFENFKRFYLNYKRNEYLSKRGERITAWKAAMLWNQLNITQRLPFIMEAFNCKVETGKVAIDDEWEMQLVMANLQK